MENKKQKLLLEYLISSTDTFAICEGIVEPDYFDPEFRNALFFIKKYYNEYNTTPSPEQIDAETGVELTLQDISPDQLDYTTKEIEKFCQDRALEKAVLGAPKLIAENNRDQLAEDVKAAILISLHRELGTNYYMDVQDRLNRMLAAPPTFTTGWRDVDELLYGGLSRKELLLVAANTGGGKSILLANLGYNFVSRGKNVLYVTLELSQDIVSQRYDTMHTGVGRRDWEGHVSEIVTKVEAFKEKHGRIDIVRMASGTSANQIRAYLKEYYLHNSIIPDLLIVDYLDKMNPNEKFILDVFTKDKLCSEQLRDIGEDYDIYVATASQLNRSAVGATSHDHSQIAGGISKINEADIYISLIFTDAMKASGEMALIFQKTRNSDGSGSTVFLKWDPKYLRLLDMTGAASGITFNKKEPMYRSDDIDDDTYDEPHRKKSLLDLMG